MDLQVKDGDLSLTTDNKSVSEKYRSLSTQAHNKEGSVTSLQHFLVEENKISKPQAVEGFRTRQPRPRFSMHLLAAVLKTPPLISNA
jgi:hypothetical protein